MEGDDLFLLTEQQSDEQDLFNRLLLTIENYGREYGAVARLSMTKMMIMAAGADIRASINPTTAHQILQEEANDHWDAMLASRKRAA